MTSEPILRRPRASKVAERPSAQAVWRIVKRRAALAGLEGDFGAHSLRSGLVTDAGRQCVPLGDEFGKFQRRGNLHFAACETSATSDSRPIGCLLKAQDYPCCPRLDRQMRNRFTSKASV